MNENSSLHSKALNLLCWLGILFGFFSRVFLIDQPAGYLFDEHHFVDNALNLLVGLKDLNDHPPLGKWILALGISLFGNNAWGWRCMPLLFGVFNILLSAAIALRLTRKTEAALLVAALVSIDGMMITYARSAHLETFILFFGLATFYAALHAASARGGVLIGLALGAAIAVKWNAIAVIVPVGMVLFSGNREKLLPLIVAVAGGVYTAVLAATASLTGQEAPFAYVFEWSRATWRHHQGLTDWVHPLLSKWYTWPFLKRPIPFENRVMEDGVHLKYVTSLGNPFLWWGLTVALAIYAVKTARRHKTLVSRAACAEPMFLLAVSWAVFVFPWALTARDTYMYHYFPAYGFGLIFLGLFLQELRESLPFKNSVPALLAVFLLVSLYFWPVWVGWPLLKGESMDYAWLKTWL